MQHIFVLLVVDTPLPVSQAVLHPHQELHARSMHHGSLLLVITIINLVPQYDLEPHRHHMSHR